MATHCTPRQLEFEGLARRRIRRRPHDITGAVVDRPTVVETTAPGAAWLAGQRAGVWPGMEAFAADWQLDRRFTPEMDRHDADERYAGWRDAVRRTLSRPDDQA